MHFANTFSQLNKLEKGLTNTGWMVEHTTADNHINVNSTWYGHMYKHSKMAALPWSTCEYKNDIQNK